MRITRAGTQPSQKGPAEYFTGSVRVDPLFQASDPSRVSGAAVTFEPGARSAWHTHPLGQTLIVTSGVGRIQRWGGPVEEIRAGDVVWTPPGVKHWHGASAVTAMTHIAIQEHLVLGAALNVGVTPVEAKEIVYQAVPYVGMAKVFDFLHVTNEVLQSRGVSLPLEKHSTTTPETRFEKGREVQRRILGDSIDKLYAHSPKDQLHIQRHLSANCFGDYYTRTGLDLKTRELLTFSIIASLGGCEPQLAGHVAGNLAVGNHRAVLVSTITQLLPFIGYPRTLNALRVINEGTAE